MIIVFLIIVSALMTKKDGDRGKRPAGETNKESRTNKSTSRRGCEGRISGGGRSGSDGRDPQVLCEMNPRRMRY